MWGGEATATAMGQQEVGLSGFASVVASRGEGCYGSKVSCKGTKLATGGKGGAGPYYSVYGAGDQPPRVLGLHVHEARLTLDSYWTWLWYVFLTRRHCP